MLTKRQPTPGNAPAMLIPLRGGLFAKVDPDLYARLSRYKWFARRSNFCVYAVRKSRRNGKETLIRMHREVANPAPTDEVHHINHDTLDNRRENLLSLPAAEHNLFHQFTG